ncbi:Lrp/AsnC family transcriptional regulator [Oceanobacter antarcticus]|uniref:Lrp/AsnC family transcriptional regulator n=1 Tax=Oceanobacter antarcticus TaxID=3133425 RepID=A0ABW8NMT8_9GAMM
MQQITLEPQDIRILTLLQQDSQIPRMQLAEQVNLSASQCFRRIRRLEECGLIRRYTVELDKQKAGFDVQAMVMLQYRKSEADSRNKVLTLIRQTDVILECYSITGEYDFLLHVCCTSMGIFNRLINETFQVSFIAGIHSYMLLECVKAEATLPLARR